MFYDLISKATDDGFYTYNPSDTNVILSGKALQDYVSVRVITSDKAKSAVGVDKSYEVPVEMAQTYRITIELLPFSEDLEFIQKLQAYIDDNGGYFQISLFNGSKFDGIYSCYIIKEGDLTYDENPEDVVFEFGAFREDNNGYALFPKREPTGLSNPMGGTTGVQTTPLIM
jgi:hypothetical protein